MQTDNEDTTNPLRSPMSPVANSSGSPVPMIARGRGEGAEVRFALRTATVRKRRERDGGGGGGDTPRHPPSRSQAYPPHSSPLMVSVCSSGVFLVIIFMCVRRGARGGHYSPHL